MTAVSVPNHSVWDWSFSRLFETMGVSYLWQQTTREQKLWKTKTNFWLLAMSVPSQPLDGFYFDELSKIRVVEPDTAEQTQGLKEECKEFVDSKDLTSFT